MVETKAILKQRKGKTIRSIGQAFVIANTTNGNILKRKEKIDLLSNRHRAGRPMKTTAVSDRNIFRALRKNFKTTVRDITNTIQS